MNGLQLPRPSGQGISAPASPRSIQTSFDRLSQTSPAASTSNDVNLDLDEEGDLAMSTSSVGSSTPTWTSRRHRPATGPGQGVASPPTSTSPSSASTTYHDHASDRLARLPPSLASSSRSSRNGPPSFFIPRPSSKQKEAELRRCSISELTERYERNMRLIQSPEALARLPDGGQAALEANTRLRQRLEDLQLAREAAERRSSRLKKAAERAEREADAQDPERAVTASLERMDKMTLEQELRTPEKRAIMQNVHAADHAGAPMLSFEESKELTAAQLKRDAEQKDTFERRQNALPRGTGKMLRDSLAMARASAISDFFMPDNSDDESDGMYDIDEEDEEAGAGDKSAMFESMLREHQKQEEEAAAAGMIDEAGGVMAGREGGLVVNWSFLE